MKKIFVLFSALVVFTACKNNENTSETNEEAKEISADFIYLDDAAVLKGDDFIYGVKIDDKAKELAKQVETVKADEFDMVPVVIKGVVNKKADNEDGWEDIVTITEIITVSKTPSKPDVKLE
ncbi:hypothetical protein [Planktosalinus lacus]|uniref:NlpE C-terminal OB domain-containing protein n=1 Tax=Planktosalinus lacus TaxID=1526573 RepID=A0A8J2V4E5_9FLAO|nr:hypothetical protein [Planktosalinus lacus]GGD81548.1 hypothetical protein GCM10011312_02390 [Planktosalinus lacus]